MRFGVLALLLLSALTLACAGDVQAPPTAPTGELFTATEETVGGTLDLGTVELDRPERWSFQSPSSSMRLAEAEIPGPGGPALLTVFFFGPGGGGGVEANLERWQGQIEPAPGEQAMRDSFGVGLFQVTTIEVEGTLQPSTMGAGPAEAVPGARLLGAVVEGPGGPWFFKITGPADTVAAAREEFHDMLRSARTTGRTP